MKAETKKKWIEDLRSGKYPQCKHVMSKKIDDVQHYCCLGVLNYITLGASVVGVQSGSAENAPEYEEFISERWYTDNITYNTCHLTYMNDGKYAFQGKAKNFNEIADWIEENIPAT